MMERYLANVTDAKPSAEQARIAGAKITDHWGEKATVADVTAEKQRAFMRGLGDKGLSVGYIARTMSVLSAAAQFALTEGHLKYAPKILHAPGTVSGIVGKPAPEPREWIPTFEQMGQILDWVKDDARSAHIWRYLVFALNTGARPAAILDFSAAQIDRTNRLLRLNPEGRTQTRKYRPTIKASTCLWAWIEHWKLTGYLMQFTQKGRRPGSMRNPFRRMSDDLGMPELSAYSIRHFVATHVYDELRKAGVADAKDHVGYLLGHRADDPTTTDRYVKFTEGFMSETVAAVDAMMARVQKNTRKPVLAPTFLPQAGKNVVRLEP